jgi:hypothetical protein
VDVDFLKSLSKELDSDIKSLKKYLWNRWSFL